MSEKIKVPRKIYEELMALNNEIHFMTDYTEVIKKADDRNYKAAVTWLMNNEEQYRLGFAHGFEPVDDLRSAGRSEGEPGMTPGKTPAPPAKPSTPQKKSGGFFSRVSGIFSKKQ
jgi:hypothetical protein